MKIQIYSTHTCHYCKALKEYLDEKKVSYENTFVDDDPKAGEEMVKKTNQMGVPVTIVTSDENKEEIVIGFDKEKINSLLGL